MRRLHTALALFLLLSALENARGAELTSGNILVAVGNTNQLIELTPDGTPVQTFTFPVVAGFHDLRDVVVDANGLVHAYNGTFTPEMHSLDPVIGTIASQTFAGWSTVNNISYGGIAASGESVFVTDMATAGAGSPQGIVRFSLTGAPTVRFATSRSYIDLTIGHNGLLYALSSNGDDIDVFDPASEVLLETIDLDFTLQIADVRSVAVDADGALYFAAWNGRLYAADSDGNTQVSLATGVNNLTDIDLNSSGTLLAGSRFGLVVVSDVSLVSATSFSSGTSNTIHVAFTDPLTFAPQVIDVAIDVKPGSDENPINLKSAGKSKGKARAAGGVIPVAVLSTDDFDAATIDMESIQFGDPELSGTVVPIKFAVEDVNDDGLEDLLLHFSRDELVSFQAIDSESVILMLTGETADGTPFAGFDLVTTIP